MSTMTQEDDNLNMAYIERAVVGEWGHNWSATVDDDWGRIYGADSSTRPFKTKGLWDFARRTLSCLKPPQRTGATVSIQRIFCGWEVRRPTPYLAVLLAKQMAAHLTEEDVTKSAPLHVHLIHNMGINKQKQEKGVGETSTTLIHA